MRGTWLTELAGCSLRDIGVVVAGLAGAAFKLSTACETGLGDPSYGTTRRLLHRIASPTSSTMQNGRRGPLRTKFTAESESKLNLFHQGFALTLQLRERTQKNRANARSDG